MKFPYLRFPWQDEDHFTSMAVAFPADSVQHAEVYAVVPRRQGLSPGCHKPIPWGWQTYHPSSMDHLWYLVPIYEHISWSGVYIYIYMNGVEHIIHWKSREHSYKCVRLCDCFGGCFDSGTWAGIARWWSWGYIRRRLAGLEMVTWFTVWDFSLEELALVFFLFPEPLTAHQRPIDYGS